MNALGMVALGLTIASVAVVSVIALVVIVAVLRSGGDDAIPPGVH